MFRLLPQRSGRSSSRRGRTNWILHDEQDIPPGIVTLPRVGSYGPVSLTVVLNGDEGIKLAFALITAAAFGIAAGSPAFAQGRHDDKPHGTQKPAATSGEQSSPSGVAGRHDDRPHGPRKPAAKKADAAPSGDGQKK